MNIENRTAALARRITWKGSKQFYAIARLLADRRLTDDCFRAYAYFRWADDVIDLESADEESGLAFARRQQLFIDRLYAGETPESLSPEEEMLVVLVSHDRTVPSGLHSFIENFMWVLAYDAGRKGRTVARADLERYTVRLAAAVMDGIQYFIGNRCRYARPPARIQAVLGAHITHMLRDMREDLPAGIINIPGEDLDAAGLDPSAVDLERLRPWVEAQVRRARQSFREGRTYIDSLDVLRCKLAGYWYCARFERVLDIIERDGFRLRADYHERRELPAWGQMLGLTLGVMVRHLGAKIRALPSRRINSTRSNPDSSLVTAQK